MSHLEEFVTDNVNNASLEELMCFLDTHIDSLFKTDKDKKNAKFKTTLRDSSNVAYKWSPHPHSIFEVSHQIRLHNGKIKLISSFNEKKTPTFWIYWIIWGVITAGIALILMSILSMIISPKGYIKQHIYSAQAMLQALHGF